MNFSEYLKKIQNLPLIKRKIIFWTILIIFGLILGGLWIISIRRTIEKRPTKDFLEEIKLPELKEKIENLPKPEMPKLEIEENLNKLEEMQKEIK
jgi:hypothetical protein